MTETSPSPQPSPKPGTPEFQALSRDERRVLRRQLHLSAEELIAHKQAAHDLRHARHARRDPWLRLGLLVCSWLPLWLAALLGELVGLVGYFGYRRMRERGLANLELALGDELDESARKAILRRCLRLSGRGACQLPKLARLGPERVRARQEIEGAECLAKALEGGKGAIIVSMHYSLYEVSGSWFTHAFGGASVGRDAGGSGPTKWLIGARAALGNRTIERGNPREILRYLKRNEPVAFVADADVRRVKGVFVPFFGTLAHTPAGPAALSFRTGAPIVILWVEWNGLTRHRVKLSGPMTARSDLPRDKAVLDLTRRYTSVFEEVIRADPAPWLWLHKRWMTRPEDRPDLPVWTGE